MNILNMIQDNGDIIVDVEGIETSIRLNMKLIKDKAAFKERLISIIHALQNVKQIQNECDLKFNIWKQMVGEEIA